MAETVGSTIRAWRKQRGWTMEELGSRMGVTGQAVQCWETGKVDINTQRIQRLAALFGTVPAAFYPAPCAYGEVSTDRDEETEAPELVTIGEREVQRLTYKGQPVVTFGIIARVHNVPDGTVRGSFHRHKQRFQEGKHYVRVTQAEHGTLANMIDFSGAGSAILFTEKGYLLLVKPMKDDVSWKVQEQMIDQYFAMRAAIVELSEEELRREALVAPQRQSRTKAYDVTVRSTDKDEVLHVRLCIPDRIWQIIGEICTGKEMGAQEARKTIHGQVIHQLVYGWLGKFAKEEIRAQKGRYDTYAQHIAIRPWFEAMMQMQGVAGVALVMIKELEEQGRHLSIDERKRYAHELLANYVRNVGVSVTFEKTGETVVFYENRSRREGKQLQRIPFFEEQLSLFPRRHADKEAVSQ